MSMVHEHLERHHPSIEWSAVSGVQPLVFIARIDNTPIAVLELRPEKVFQLTACSGIDLGDFPHIDAARDALQRWVDSRA